MWNKIGKFFLKLVCPFANKVWWPVWSNIRWYKESKINVDFRLEDSVLTLSDIKKLVKKLYNNFEWTADKADQLWDSICPPMYNYKRYLDGLLKDDCDGFHALVYHCLYNSGIECYLLSAVALGGGHCILLFKFEDEWYVNDYNTVYSAKKTPNEAIEAYNKKFVEIYETKSEVVHNQLLRYDYDKRKYKAITLK